MNTDRKDRSEDWRWNTCGQVPLASQPAISPSRLSLVPISHIPHLETLARPHDLTNLRARPRTDRHEYTGVSSSANGIPPHVYVHSPCYDPNVGSRGAES